MCSGGKYFVNGDEEVALGHDYIAHPSEWTQAWVKFVYKELVDKRLFRVADRKAPPERDELDERDKIGTCPGRANSVKPCGCLATSI